MPADQPVTSKLRWLYPTPDRLFIVLLVVEGILLLSERWFPKGWTVLIAVAAVGLFLLLMLLRFIVSLIFRWHFQFSIRSLLLLTVIVAILCSWMTMELRWARKQREAVDAVVSLGGYVNYDYQFDSSSKMIYMVEPTGPVWMRNVFGDDFFINVTYVNLWRRNATNANLKQFEGLTHLKSLHLLGTKVTDAGLEHLEGLKELQWLDLEGTQVTDAGVATLRKSLPKLEIQR